MQKAKTLGKDFEAQSAGVFASEGFPASQQAIEVLKRDYNIDISKHRSKNLKTSRFRRG